MPSLKLSTYLQRYPGLRNGTAHMSKRVLHRIKAGHGLRSSIEVLKDEAGAAFRARLEKALGKGEPVPDHGRSLDLMGRWLMAAIDRLDRADYDYVSAGLAREARRRDCRRQAKVELYPRVRDLRQLLESTFGKEEGALLHGIQGKTLRKPRRLYEQATDVVVRLKDPGHPLPPARTAGTPVDREGWLRTVATPYDRLGEMLEKVSQLEFQERDALDRRDAELEEFDRVYREVYDYVKAVYVIAGKNPRLLRLARPLTERRRLAHKSRQEAEARADGRRPKRPASLRAALSTMSDWLGRGGPKNVA